MGSREDIERALIESLEDDDDAGPVAPREIVTGLGPGVYDIDMPSYLADPALTPSLRSSDIQRILKFRPSHVRAYHPRLCDPAERDWVIRKVTPAMDVGSAIHSLVLGVGSRICVIDKTKYTTKDGKPAKGETAEYKADVAAAKSRGLLVLSPARNVLAKRAAERLRVKLAAEFPECGEFPFGNIEETLIWEEQTEHGPVPCRARPDLNAPEFALIVEAKSSAAGLDQRGIDRSLSANDGAYFVQAAFQRRGMAATYPELAGRIAHVHAWIETTQPYEPRVAPPSTVKLEMADRRITRAIAMFAEWRATGEFSRGWERTIGEGDAWLEREWIADEDKEMMR